MPSILRWKGIKVCPTIDAPHVACLTISHAQILMEHPYTLQITMKRGILNIGFLSQ